MVWPKKYKFKGFVSEWIEWVKRNHRVRLWVSNKIVLSTTQTKTKSISVFPISYKPYKIIYVKLLLKL